MNGNKKAVYIDSSTTAKETLDDLCSKLGIVDSSGFAIYEVYKQTILDAKGEETSSYQLGNHFLPINHTINPNQSINVNILLERSLQPGDNLSDILAKHEQFGREALKKDKNIKVSFALFMKCKLFLKPREISNDRARNDLLAAQAC
jgi:hypothetical protein